MTNTATARDAALAGGIDQINGLVILGDSGLEAWYNANIKGGSGAFVHAASSFGDFSRAVEGKIVAEVSNTGAPTPGVAMAGLMLIGGLGMSRRRAIAV